MKFIINNAEYEIKRVKEETIKKESGGDYFACCLYYQGLILMPLEIQKNDRQLLRHEVTHAFMFANGIHGEEFNAEDVCNMFGAFGGEIEGIVKKYYDINN